MTTLYLVRHGETVDNARQIMQGQTQGELNATGISQAEALRDKLSDIHIDAFVSSDLYRPVFPVVGLGSMALGVILALMPTTFITSITYIFALILIMAAANQFIGLAHIRQIVRIRLFYWVVPSVVMIIGLTALIRPEWIASAPLIIIGWAMVVYGVSESVNTLKAHAARRAYKQMIPQFGIRFCS